MFGNILLVSVGSVFCFLNCCWWLYWSNILKTLCLTSVTRWICRYNNLVGFSRLVFGYFKGVIQTISRLMRKCLHIDTETLSALYTRTLDSVSNGSRLVLRVRVWVGTEWFPNWRTWSSMHLNRQFGYGSMDISQPLWIGRVVSRLSAGSICIVI